MSQNLLLVVQVVMSVVAIGLVIKISPRIIRKANSAMLGLTTDFSGEDSDQEVMSVSSMEITSAAWAMKEKNRLEVALLDDELSGKLNTERTRRYYSDRTDAELDNQLHDRIHRLSRRQALQQMKDSLYEGRMVQYQSCRSGLRQARIVGYSKKSGKSFTARLRLMGSDTIVRRHISRLTAA